MSAQRRTATKQRRAASQQKASSQPKATTANPVAQDGGSARPPKPAPAPAKAAPERESVLTTRFQRLRKLIQDTWSEIKKVTWPDGQTARNLTALVIVMSTVLGLLLGGIDYVLLKVFDALS